MVYNVFEMSSKDQMVGGQVSEKYSERLAKLKAEFGPDNRIYKEYKPLD